MNLTTETLYRKEGRRYVPVAEGLHDIWQTRYHNIFPEGVHLVVVQPGSTSYKFRIEADNVGLLAAAKIKQDKIRDVIVEGHKLRPSERKPLTEYQRKKYDEFVASVGEEVYYLEYPSVQEIADNVIKELCDESNVG